MEICYKTTRDLLVNITRKYTELISHILFKINESLSEVNATALYILKRLPIDSWKPTYEVYELLAKWLITFSIDSIESKISRLIIQDLNWNLDR